MKVLILSTTIAPYRVNLFNELGKYCDLTVCFEQKLDKTREDVWYEKEFKNFEGIFLEKWEKGLNYLKKDIKKYINKENIDIAIAYEYSTVTSMYFMRLCNKNNIPYVINCDGAFIRKNMFKDTIKRYFIEKSSGYLASGENAKEYFLNYGAQEKNIYFHNFTTLYKKDILPEVVSEEEKSKLRKKLDIKGKKVIISVGRFIESKRFDILIKQWKYMKDDTTLILIGNGEMKTKYQEIINELNIKNINILDFKCKEDLMEYYKASDLFILPTKEDTWGLVINEAMAVGLPVITTDKCIAGLELITKFKDMCIISDEHLGDIKLFIENILNNKKLTKSISEENLKVIKQYTYENSAEKHIRSLKTIYKNYNKINGAYVNE